MADGDARSGSAPLLAAVLPLVAGPATLGLLVLGVGDLQELWLQGGRGPMTAAAVVAALAAAASGMALYVAAAGRTLALGGLPALALVVMLPGLVGARLGWGEVARVMSSSAPVDRPLILAAGGLEVQRGVQVTLLFDAVLFGCWAGALLVLADRRAAHRRTLAGLALISVALCCALGDLASAELLLAEAGELVAHLAPTERVAAMLPVLARWSTARLVTRVAWGLALVTVTGVALLVREGRARVAVVAWAVLSVVGVAGTRALAAVPPELTVPVSAPFDPAKFLAFEGADEDVSNVTHVLSGERLDGVEDRRLETHRHRLAVLVARDARVEGLSLLLRLALERDEGAVDLVGLDTVTPPAGTEVPTWLRPLLQRATSVHVEVASTPRCDGVCPLARLDAEGLQLDDGQRWGGEDLGPGRVNPSKPLVVRLAPWEPRWLVRAAHAAAKRGFTLVVTAHEPLVGLASSRVEGAPVVRGPLSMNSVQEVLRAPGCLISGAGRVTLRFVVGEGGVVSRVDVVSSTVRDVAFEECLARGLRELRFPRAKGSTLVTQQFVAAPEGR